MIINDKELTMGKELFYTTSEVAKQLRVSHLTIYRYIKAGRLSAYKIGRDFRISHSALSKFLQERKVK
jgi:excisionase family DNA binding protein